ncbi:hypothetical protein M1446_01845 [Candidatus Dependentiae bacterium]|nr:hypothetical protein [Candidatus Dependentiae bacterium]
MKNPNKPDVQFIVDEKGNPSAVVIDIDLYEQLIEQLEELKFGAIGLELAEEEKKIAKQKKKK